MMMYAAFQFEYTIQSRCAEMHPLVELPKIVQ